MGSEMCIRDRDAASRGRILLFEVDYVPCRRKSRSGGKGRGVGHAPRFTLTHAKKVRGAVSQCAQVMEHIIVSVANRVEVYSVEGKDMKQIATHHAPHYVVASQRLEFNFNVTRSPRRRRRDRVPRRSRCE